MLPSRCGLVAEIQNQVLEAFETFKAIIAEQELSAAVVFRHRFFFFFGSLFQKKLELAERDFISELAYGCRASFLCSDVIGIYAAIGRSDVSYCERSSAPGTPTTVLQM